MKKLASILILGCVLASSSPAQVPDQSFLTPGNSYQVTIPLASDTVTRTVKIIKQGTGQWYYVSADGQQYWLNFSFVLQFNAISQ